MADIALRGNRLTAAKGGRAALRFGGGRTNLLEELGRVEGERSNPNRRAEISRVHGELNRGYKDGGRIGFRTGKGVVPRRSQPPHKETMIPSRLDSQRKNIRLRAERKKVKYRDPNTAKPEWSLNKWGLKEGGKADKKWIQKAVDPKHKGYCTPMTKKTCTPARKALARTFKKKAKTGWG